MNRSSADAIRTLLGTQDVELPRPGAGHNVSRLLTLCDLARRLPIGVARLAEAHMDAVAILAEAGREPVPDAFYGVWASQHATRGVVYDAARHRLDGSIGFASGIGVADRALVTAHTSAGTFLVDLDVSSRSTDSVTFDTRAWSTPALADTFTGSATFDAHPVASDDVVAEPGWYLDRHGFWKGACAPAACWAGGALGLVDAAGRYVDDDPHRRAHHGALLAHAWSLMALLRSAGTQIDDHPDDAHIAEKVARSLRFTVTTICRDVMDRFGRAFGPRPYTEDAAIAQRAIDLDLYIKQHHAERELPAISALHEPA